jgi:hypothetical protein
MRALLLVALLIPGWALAVDTQFCAGPSKYGTSVENCGGGSDSCCPLNLSNPDAGANVTNTTGDGSVVTDRTGGTVYACVRLDTSAKATGAQIVAGSPCVDADNLASAAGTVEFTGGNTFSGLTAETSYIVDYTATYDNQPGHEVLSSAVFSTLAAPGGGGTDLTGAGLFLAKDDAGNTDETPTGNDGTQTSGCTSMPNSCSEYSHVGTPAEGQAVYFSEGGDWNNREFQVQHSGGSASTRVVIGCYFDEGDDDGNPVRCDDT